jgi:hypothetical protein
MADLRSAIQAAVQHLSVSDLKREYTATTRPPGVPKGELSGYESLEEDPLVFSAPWSANQWKAAQEYAKKRGFPQTDSHILLALQLYSDKTTKRSIGGKPYYPIFAMILNLDSETRSDPYRFVLVGYIPVWDPPSGLGTAARRQKKVSFYVDPHPFEMCMRVRLVCVCAHAPDCITYF